MRKTLEQLIREVTPYWAEVLADYLMRNGVVIPVHCKDCKWYKIAEDLVPYCSHESGYCGEYMGGLFYCAMGERKDHV